MRERVREKKREKYLEGGSIEHRALSTGAERSAICDLWSTICDLWWRASDEQLRRGASEWTTMTVGLVCSVLGFGFGLLCIGVFYFLFLINISVLEFVLLLLCIDYIGVWFSLLVTWPWVWFLILCIGFFYLFFFRICGFATSVICWACHGLGFVTIFFFFSNFSSNFFFFNLNVFLILWLRVFLIQIKYFFFRNTLSCTWRCHWLQVVKEWLDFFFALILSLSIVAQTLSPDIPPPLTNKLRDLDLIDHSIGSRFITHSPDLIKLYGGLSPILGVSNG